MHEYFKPLRLVKSWQKVIDFWIGSRSYYFSGSDSIHLSAMWTAIVMSHRRRHPEQSVIWRTAIESSLHRCRESHSLLLASIETPLGAYLIQAAHRAHVPSIELHLPLPNESMIEWELRVISARQYSIESNESLHRYGQTDRSESWSAELWVSPALDPTEDVGHATAQAIEGEQDALESMPLVDRALLSLADVVHVVAVHPKSKTEKLLYHRLADSRFPIASVFVAIPPRATNSDSTKKASALMSKNRSGHDLVSPTPTLSGLLDCGAVGWLPSHSTRIEGKSTFDAHSDSKSIEFAPTSDENPTVVVPTFSAAIQQVSWAQEWPYLTHCTRGRSGAWPDQSQTGYFDSLLASQDRADLDASPLATLERILTQCRLIASSKLKRSDMPTVSFTEIPLMELLTRRHFKSHIGRWDWEPYGICIRRSWLEGHGCRRVLYLESSKWNLLDAQERPYFQPTSEPNATKGTNWEAEREWRALGDIQLGKIPFDSAFVFVPTAFEADKLSCLSPLSVCVLSH